MCVPNFSIHPAIQILLWLGFAVVVQGLDIVPLAVLTMLAVFSLLIVRNSGALHMLRRVRWLLLSLMLIYAFATPGDPIFPAFGMFGPSLQGLRGGGMQAWRLALLLVALALLLRSCPRESLLSGLYVLLRPFRKMGLNADRVAVRLWLTLRYAEQQPRQNIQAWWHELRSSLDGAPAGAAQVTLELAAFTWRDAAVLALATIMAVLALW